MNRLILIGNGFDLAHGLKTSYLDFILWYLGECFSKVGYISHEYEDDLIKIDINDIDNFYKLVLEDKKVQFKTHIDTNDLIEFLKKKFYENSLIEFLNILNPEIADLIFYDNESSYFNNNYSPPIYSITIKSSFFRSLIINIQDLSWVDIEQEYFNALKKFNDSNNSHDFDYVRTLNINLGYLKSKLEEYLTLQENTFNNMAHFNFAKLLGQEFKFNDFETSIINQDELKYYLGLDNTKTPIQHSAYILNFNYTNTFYPYLREIQGKTFSKVEINHIHGQINNHSNPLIFGFGDEYDKDYASFEEHSNNSLFEHVKSYHYLKTPNYRNLICFLNEGFYEVYIVGHSCGLSDRTMLKEIFDHENCKSVRIFHYTNEHGQNDFFDKSINLGRHFSNKGRMRKLVVNFNETDAISQLKK